MSVETRRVALVTGASSGIGEAAAHALRGEGFTVYGTSRRAVAGEERDGVVFLALDVTDDQSVADSVREVLARSGRIDVLVNNAGISGVGDPKPFLGTSLEEWNAVLGNSMANSFQSGYTTQMVDRATRSSQVFPSDR